MTVRRITVVAALAAALARPAGDAPVPFDYVVIDAQAPPNAHCKTLADLDGDGLLDAVVASSSGGGIVWYENPKWTKHVIAASGSFTTDMQAADIDGDGDLDIVVPIKNPGVQEVRWYQNPGKKGPAWKPHTVADYAQFGFPTAHDVEIGDMNGDGKLDIVVSRQVWKGPRGTNHPETIVFLQETPDRWSQVIVDRTYGEGTALADLDGDGDLDIVRPGYWLEAPDWTRHDIMKGWPDQAGVTVADMNQDGRPDVVLSAAETPGRLSWFEAPSNPRRGPWIEHRIDDPVDYVHTFKVADMDLDGRPDVVFAEMQQSERKRVGFYRNEGGGKKWRLQVLATTGSHNLRVGDVDSDGDIDIFGVNWNSPTDPRRAPVELWRNQLDRRQ